MTLAFPPNENGFAAPKDPLTAPADPKGPGVALEPAISEKPVGAAPIPAVDPKAIPEPRDTAAGGMGVAEIRVASPDVYPVSMVAPGESAECGNVGADIADMSMLREGVTVPKGFEVGFIGAPKAAVLLPKGTDEFEPNGLVVAPGPMDAPKLGADVLGVGAGVAADTDVLKEKAGTGALLGAAAGVALNVNADGAPNAVLAAGTGPSAGVLLKPPKEYPGVAMAAVEGATAGVPKIFEGFIPESNETFPTAGADVPNESLKLVLTPSFALSRTDAVPEPNPKPDDALIPEEVDGADEDVKPKPLVPKDAGAAGTDSAEVPNAGVAALAAAAVDVDPNPPAAEVPPNMKPEGVVDV